MPATPIARRLLSAALACGVAALALPAGASAAFGDVQVLAPFPNNPGFPEGVAVRNGRVYSAGAATFGTAGKGPSAVIVHSRATGALIKRFDTVGENLAFEHANSSIAFDGKGRLYVLNTQLGMYRLKSPPARRRPTRRRSPTCRRAASRPSRRARRRRSTPRRCPTTSRSPNGDAFVSDSLQATIWRVPGAAARRRSGARTSRFASLGIGVNGLRLDRSGTRLYVTVTSDLLGKASVYSMWRLPYLPSFGPLKLVHSFAPTSSPTGSRSAAWATCSSRWPRRPSPA